MRRLRLIAAVTAAAAALFAAASSSQAATFVERPCVGEAAWGLWSHADRPGWFVDSACPDGFSFYRNTETQSGEPAAEFSLETLTSQIESFSGFIVRPDSSSDGLEMTVAACRFADCGRAVDGTETGDGHVGVTRSGPDPDAEIPEGANRLLVRVRCVDVECPASAPVQLNDLTLTRSDDSPPLFDLFPTVKVGDGPDPTTDEDDEYAQSFDPPTWTNGRLNFGAEEADPESHTAYLRFDIDGLSICAPVYDPQPVVSGCTTIPPYQRVTILASDIADGHHLLTGTAVNAAGLSSTDSIEVLTDATPPARPAQFKMTPRFNGWSGSRDVKLDWTNSGETTETSEQSGIAGFRYDVSPVTGGENPPPPDAVDPPEKYVEAPAAHSLQYRFPSAGEWLVAITTVDAAGNSSQSAEADVNIDDARPAAPNFDPIPPINAEDAASGRTINWSYGDFSVSGLCGHDYAFNPSATFNPGEDPSSPTLPGDATSLTLTPQQVMSLSERPQRFNIRGYSCAGVPGAIAHPPVTVDFTPPAITLAPAGGVVSAGEPVLIGVTDSKLNSIQSGVATVTCTIDGQPVDCSTDSGVSLRPGRNPLVVTATDAAGNSTSTSAEYIADASAPEGWFEQTDPGDPTLVRAVARDAGSGLSSADIEFQPLEGGAWNSFGTGFASDAPNSSPVALSARIPDAGQLPDGEYRLRLTMRDASGQSAVVTGRAGGGEATFTVPVRASSVLTARLSSAGGGNRPGLTTLLVDHGVKTRIAGRLTTPTGAPIAGADLIVTAVQAGAPPRPAGSTTTSADGSYAIPIARGASRKLTVRFAGNPVARPVTADAKLLVKGKVSLKIRRQVVKSGERIVFSGTVFHDGAAPPVRGKSIRIVFAGSDFRLEAIADAAGKFAVSHRFSARRRPLRFSVRALVTADAGWPFEPAFSQRVNFTVKP